MNPILQAAIGSIARWLLAILAGWFVKAGIWTESEAATYIAAGALALVALGWSFYQKYKSRSKLLTALTLPEGASENDLKSVMKSDSPKPSITTPPSDPPSASRLPLLLLLGALALAMTGCASGKKLEIGGAYAPTNEVGQVVYNDVGLALADASYKFAYETVLDVMAFERNNRVAIWAISPEVKKGLDAVRPDVVDINRRWAESRKIYKANPTPAGLDTIQQILSEMRRILPVVQKQIDPVYKSLTSNQNP